MNLAGREQDVYSLLSSCIGFYPTAPVGVNSYYPWALGRFLQEDALEGSATLPASQNRYVYCQNNPVSLIDPTGYSPENTGTPSRFGQGNPAILSTSNNACITGSSDGFDPLSGARIMPDQYINHNLKMPGWDGCYEVRKVAEDDEGNTYYEVTINGVTVIVVRDVNGNFRAGYTHSGEPTDAERGIVAGLNAAFRQMEKEDFTYLPAYADQFLRDIVSFAKDNLGTFASILGGNDTFWIYHQFMKHATIGKVIADVIKNDPYTGEEDKKNNRKYDHSIAFWVSYYDEKMGYNSTLRTYADSLDENGQYTDDTVLGLIDQARLMKAIQYKENASQYIGEMPFSPGDWGIMSVNEYWLGTMLNQTKYENIHGKNFLGSFKSSMFSNIGAGIGMLYAYHYEGVCETAREYGWKGSGGNRVGGNRSKGFTLRDAKWSIFKYNMKDHKMNEVSKYMNAQNPMMPRILWP